MQSISCELKQLQIIQSEGNSGLHRSIENSECFVTDIAYGGSFTGNSSCDDYIVLILELPYHAHHTN